MAHFDIETRIPFWIKRKYLIHFVPNMAFWRLFIHRFGHMLRPRIRVEAAQFSASGPIAPIEYVTWEAKPHYLPFTYQDILVADKAAIHYVQFKIRKI